MQAFKRKILFVVLLVFGVVAAQPARAETIESTDGTKIVSLLPLRNGLSAITLVWPIDPLTLDRANALQAESLQQKLANNKSQDPNKFYNLVCALSERLPLLQEPPAE